MEITEELISLAEIFKRNGRSLYIVGGSVRDSLFGIKAKDIDYDLCSDVTPRQLIDIIDGTDFELQNVNGKIGVMKIIGEKQYEYVTFRKDVYDGESHYPVEVKFVDTIEEDVRRRDFKINAIYYDILGGKIIDPLNGLDDIKNKLITTTRNPRIVYEDDPERILRALRLSILLDYTIPENEMEILEKNIPNLEYLSKKRIRKEFEKMLVLDKIYENYEMGKFAHFRILELMGKLGLWRYILPEMDEIMRDTSTNENGERFYPYILNSLKYVPEDIRLPVLIENMAKYKFSKLDPKTANLEEIIKEVILNNLGENGLNYPKQEIENVEKIILGSKFMCGFFTTKSKLREFIFDNRFVYKQIISYKNILKLDEKEQKKNAKTIEKLEAEHAEIEENNYILTIDKLNIGGEELIKNFPKIKLDKLDELKTGILKRMVVLKKKNIKEDLINLGAKEIESNPENYLEQWTNM